MHKTFRIFILLMAISISLAAAANTPTPPSIDPLPLPSGWVKVIDSGLTDTRNICISDMATFMDKVYLATRRSFESPTQINGSAEIFVSEDGKEWYPLTITEIGDQNTVSFELIPFRNRLLVMPKIWRGNQRAAALSSEGMELLTNEPFITTNNRVSLTDNRFSFIYDLFDQLLVGMNNKNGVQLWQGTDEYNLQPVVLDGMGNDGNTSFAVNSSKPVIFKGEIYVGTTNNKQGGQIWRSKDGANWQIAVKNGIDNPLNQSLKPEMVISDQLLARSFRWSVDGKITNQLYRSDNGISWEPVTINLQTTELANFSNMTMERLHDEVYLAVNSDSISAQDSENSLTNSNSTGFFLLKSGNGIYWQPTTLEIINNRNIETASLASNGDYLSLIMQEYENNSQVWLITDANNWRQIYEAPQHSDTAAGYYTYFENGRLYLAECDRTAGFTLWQYQLDIPVIQGRQVAIATQPIPSLENKNFPINRVVVTIIVLIILLSAWYTSRKF